MRWRAGGALLAAVLVTMSALVGPVAAIGPAAADPRPDRPATYDHTPADPENDTLGWEAGYWYNESIRVDQSDGLNDSELNATVARTMARVEVIRQLEFKRRVPVEIETRESFDAQRANRSTDAALRRFDNVKFEALFLVGEDADSIDVQNENAGTAVLGFYSPSRDAIVVISESGSDLQLDELTLAHELVHALQDQYFNLTRYDARTRDGANAENGLIEGDASLVEFRYERRCTGEGDWNGTCLSQSGGGGGGSLANIGTYLVKFQPYSDGPSFVQSLYSQGGWDAVNAAYGDVPASAEQVIHPEKYGVDPPTQVELEDRNSDAWERVRPPNRPDYGEVGEAALTTMLVFPLYQNPPGRIVSPNEWLNRTAGGELSSFDPLNYGHPYSAGWDGDRLHVYVNAANETAYVWRLVWDSPAEAEEFLEGYSQVLEYWGGEEVEPGRWVIEDGGFADAFHVRVEGDTVTIVNAPAVEQLDEVRAGTLATPTTTPPETPPETPSPTVSPSPSPSPTPTPGQPGFGIVAALAGLAGALLWRRRR